MFSKKEIIEILKNSEYDNELFSRADKVRQENVGDEVHLRGLVEFSNICKRNCKYCGLQCSNRNIERYRILKDDILSYVKNAVDIGYKTIVLQSGEDEYYTQEKMCDIISDIKKYDVALTLSIGERSYDEYKSFKECGADRYLLRIETTDKELYKYLHPNSDYDNRLKCLYNLKELGYELGTGCMVGLPNQSIESLAEDILFFKEIDADMIGIGPFIPHPDTLLKNEDGGDFILALKVMAITRIMMPTINIPATTAMETLNPNGRIIALQSGANVVMPNITEFEYRKNYEIYPGKAQLYNSLGEYRFEIEEKIKSIGRYVSKTRGNRKK